MQSPIQHWPLPEWDPSAHPAGDLEIMDTLPCEACTSNGSLRRPAHHMNAHGHQREAMMSRIQRQIPKMGAKPVNKLTSVERGLHYSPECGNG